MVAGFGQSDHRSRSVNGVLHIYFILFLLRIWVFGLHVCLNTTYVPDAHRSLKRMLDALQLELQMVVSYHVVTGK